MLNLIKQHALDAKRRGRIDPTQTTLLRRAFSSDLEARFRALKANGVTSSTSIKRTVIGTERYWTKYTERAYRKGVERAWTLAKRSVPADEFDILKRDFMKQMQRDIKEEGKRLAQRVYSELENVAQNTATRVARAIADGRTKGWSQRAINEAVREAMDMGRRAANAVAHTEITRAFADGQLSAFDSVGMEYIEIEMEWVSSGLGTTAKGNPSPCPKCAKFVGRRFTLKQAKGLIPFHPWCMCSFVPVFDL